MTTCSHRRLVHHFAHKKNEECCFLFRTERVARAKKYLIRWENSGPGSMAVLVQRSRESPISIAASDPITLVPTEQSYPGPLQSTWRHL